MNFVAVVNLEGIELFLDRVSVHVRREVEGKHSALLVRYQPLYFNVPQCCRGENSSGKIEHVEKRFLIAELVDCRAANHALHSHNGTKRRHHQGIAVLESLQIPRMPWSSRS